MVAETTTTLIVAPPGRFRDSLRVLLSAVEEISIIGQADDSTVGLQMIADENPLLVFLDAELLEEDAWHLLEQFKNGTKPRRCLVLSHSSLQQQKAHNAGADRILPDGFSTEILFETLQSLIHEVDNQIANTGRKFASSKS